MGKSARRRRQDRRLQNTSPLRQSPPHNDQPDHLLPKAETELARLVRKSLPGNLSVAGAYAVGYSALRSAKQEDDEPTWYNEFDPLDVLFLGTVWPKRLRGGYEFANARTAWFRRLRGTMYWREIECFIREVLTVSEKCNLPIDSNALMLLLAERLVVAGLDQRRFPRDLLPDKVLIGARIARGPDPGLALPSPPSDSAERVARLRMALDVEPLEQVTAADALRHGLHMLADMGMDINDDSSMLLPALYTTLVANDNEDLSEAGERSLAWALGLSDDSPLVQVTDVFLMASQRGLDVDTTLRHLFGIPAFSEYVRAVDRQWHSSPGTSLIDLAFELGHQEVTTRRGKVIYLGQDAALIVEAQRRRFVAKFSRQPRPGDPLFFDPDSDESSPTILPGAENATVTMLKAAGTYAYHRTGGILPRRNGTFADERDSIQWHEAIDRYMRDHQSEN